MKQHNSTFLNPDFLLYTDQAKALYHNYAKDLPIIDYHNHLPADARFIVFDVLLIISGSSFNVFVYGQAFNNIPDQTCTFN